MRIRPCTERYRAAGQGRLHQEEGGGAWCPRKMIDMEHLLQEFLEVDLLSQHVITSVVVQGRYDNGLGQEYTEHYVLMYWREDDTTWHQYMEGDNRLLQANINTYQPVQHTLRDPVITSKVR